MIKFVALWNVKPGVTEEEFEQWYADRHMGDAKRIPGLVGYTVSRGLGDGGDPARYYRMAELCFADEESFERAFVSPEWKRAFEDAQGYIADHVRLRFESTQVELKDGAAT